VKKSAGSAIAGPDITRSLRDREAQPLGETGMAKGEQKSNRETKKPKKDKIKTIAAAPSQKTAGWQPSIGTGKKK
jgi:hypothetical protein